MIYRWRHIYLGHLNKTWCLNLSLTDSCSNQPLPPGDSRNTVCSLRFYLCSAFILLSKNALYELIIREVLEGREKDFLLNKISKYIKPTSCGHSVLFSYESALYQGWKAQAAGCNGRTDARGRLATVISFSFLGTEPDMAHITWVNLMRINKPVMTGLGVGMWLSSGQWGLSESFWEASWKGFLVL